MIEPNFDLFLWCIFIFYALNGVINILAGVVGIERGKNYGMGEVVVGLFMLLIVFAVCVF